MASFLDSLFSKKKEQENNLDNYNKKLAEERNNGLIKVNDSVVFRDNILKNIEEYGLTQSHMKNITADRNMKVDSYMERYLYVDDSPEYPLEDIREGAIGRYRTEEYKLPLENFKMNLTNLKKDLSRLNQDNQDYKDISKYLKQINRVEFLVDSINQNFGRNRIEKISLDNQNLNTPAINVKFKNLSLSKSFDQLNIADNILSIKNYLEKIEYNEGKTQFIQDKRDNTQSNFDIYDHSDLFISGYKDAESDYELKMYQHSQEVTKPLKYDLNELLDEVEMTNDITEAIWITPDNKMVWGEYDLGVRGADHRDILDIYDLDRDNTKSWDKIHEIGFIRVVTETDTALVYDNQPFSKEQKENLEKGGFKIESYGTLEKVKSHENDNNKVNKREKDEGLER